MPDGPLVPEIPVSVPDVALVATPDPIPAPSAEIPLATVIPDKSSNLLLWTGIGLAAIFIGYAIYKKTLGKN